MFAMKSITAIILLAAATVVAADNSSLSPASGSAASWDVDPVAWHLDGATFVSANAGRALAPSPKGRRVTIRAKVTPESTTEPEYSSMGVGIFDDLDRYWNLAVLKGPESKGSWHRYELKAMGEGIWGAEESLMRRTLNKRSAEWKWGQVLELSFSFSPEKVEGVVTDAATGAELYHCVHEAREGTTIPVPAGRPCLFVSGDMRGRIENVKWTVEDEVPDKTREFPAYRPVGPETGIRGKATGFFHMEKINGRDWAIDPLGRATVLAGVDWCNPQGTMCAKLGYRPYGRWVKQHYASNDEWAKETAERLGSWGFTFLPCGGDVSLRYRTLAWANAADRVYFSHRMCRGDPNWRICEYRPAPCTAFPNVFHPDFEAACDWWARQRCTPYCDDPWLVGYFIDNELAWWGDVFANKATGLWDVIAKKPKTHPAKKALLAYVAAIGGAGEAPRPLSSVTPEQKLGFLRLIAERYFSVMTAAIRKADPNHMVLGCRFAGGPKGVHPVIMEVAGKYCDIVSFNHYPWADLDKGIVFDSRSNQTPVVDLYREAQELAKKPFLQTEWSFPALDTGRPCLHGAGQRFRTQAERVQACELYASTLLSLPYFAGYSFFRWVDQPALGIRPLFPEDSNYGLVSEENVPYEGLTRMFARLQSGEHLRMHNAQCTMHNGESGTRNAATNGLVQVSERERYFAEAAATNCALCIVHHAFSPDGAWVMSNDCVRLTGRVGGKYMVDEIAWSDGASFRPVGRWGSLVQWDDHGSPQWTDISRVTDVSFTNDAATGVITLTIRAEGVLKREAALNEPQGEGGNLKREAHLRPRSGHLSGEAALNEPQGEKDGPAFAFTHRLSLAPGAREILAEIVSFENTGDAPIPVQFFMMRPFAIEKAPGLVDTVPNLWKGPVEDYWLLSDGSRYGIASLDPGVLSAKIWYREPDATQHPDVRCMSDGPFTLAPGKTFVPPVPMGVRIRFLPK